ncbi:MAG: hypothetical protein HeimC3_24420 [Candidatus Heimdallarchaeota archaeon LC_3]|nr:MAG: hypothetical protein HeimC3_24420 [Candidatus Heimdallarchaeota archaeon LC_3]
MVTWANSNSKYVCSKCLNPPQDSQDVLRGCTVCGNKLFKLEANSETNKMLQQKENFDRSNNNVELSEVTSISIPKNGIFEIDVESLMKKIGPEPIAIIDNKGKIYLNL